MSVQVTEQDLRDERYKEGQPEDYEFRADGEVVRKDRWERGFRRVVSITHLANCRSEFDIDSVVELFAETQHARGKEIEGYRAALEELAKLGNGSLYGNSDGNMIARRALGKEVER